MPERPSIHGDNAGRDYYRVITVALAFSYSFGLQKGQADQILYRNLNKISVGDAYPIPCIDQAPDDLHNTVVHSTKCSVRLLDRRKPHRQDQDHFFLMAIDCFTLPVFRLGFNLGKVLAYLDDVVIYTRTFEDHLEYIDLLNRAGFRLNLEKLCFATYEFNFLGYLKRGYTQVMQKRLLVR